MAPTAPSKRRSIRARAASSTTPKSAATPSQQPLNLKTKKAKRLARHTALISRIHRTAPQRAQPRQTLPGLGGGPSPTPKTKGPRGGIQKRTGTSTSSSTKTRRPSKKLAANLSSLVSALPSLADDDGDAKDGSAPTAVKDGRNDDLAAKKILLSLRQTSLRSRPGALKRKEKVTRWEMKEFGRNLAASLQQQQPQPQDQEMGVGFSLTSTGTPVMGAEAASATQPSNGGHAGGSSTASQGGATATSSRWAELRKHISLSMDLD